MEIRFYPPAEMNSTPGTRREAEVIVLAGGGMVYGPYCALEAGQYTAVFGISVAPGGSAQLDVYAGETIAAAQVQGSGRIAVDFTLPAPTAPVEFRMLNTSAPGLDAVFFGVTLTRR